ncbi:hypothetical protein SLEP1_g27408 [Rubroshorea leprosula]|uniref:Peptidase S54 rhomboid domain-containing protein n=2 Tax=Rubroshorea leprosula TaxID=152421 RepID=A0AAV5JWE1_9ROSI|nr:hypothetical protein SLEP1_g27408 [Rubroshorea leprosula]
MPAPASIAKDFNLSSLTVSMAVAPLCYKMPYKDINLPNGKLQSPSQRGFINSCFPMLEGARCFSSISNYSYRKWHALNLTSNILTELEKGSKVRVGVGFHRRSLHVQTIPSHCNTEDCLRLFSRRALPKENSGIVWYSSESTSTERQLRLLDSYFGKLQGDIKKNHSVSSDKEIELLDRSWESNTKKGLLSLDAYLGKLNNEDQVSMSISGNQTNEGNLMSTPLSANEDVRTSEEGKFRSYTRLRRKDVETASRSQASQKQNGTSDLYLISILASINIAVFLFEIASPVRNSDLGLFSLPSLYGAKINHLILVGEWWRLVTPMFLHSGILHVFLGCWALLTFGPRVCRVYGSFTFLLIYILGGIAGNLTSFLHTPEPTVGGTGPVFAIIGAWLIFQLQNKDVIEKDVSEKMLQKTIIATALSCMLSNFGPIDDWTHLGAVFTGMVYGFFTCPIVQLDDTSSTSRAGQEEQIMLVGQDASLCKSLAVFTIFVMVLTSLVLFIEPPLDTSELEEFLQNWRK